MDVRQVGRIIHPRRRLDNLPRKTRFDPILTQILLPRRSRHLMQPQLKHPLRQRPKREERRLIQLQERRHGALDQLHGAVGAQPVPPPQPRDIPPPALALDAAVHDLLAVVDGRVVARARGTLTGARERQVERLGRGEEDAVDLDEDGGAELDGRVRVVVGVDGERAPADVPRLLEDGDVQAEALLDGVLLQVVRRGRAGSARAWE